MSKVIDMSVRPLSFILIGEGGLLVACAERLLEAGQIIVRIVSADESTRQWAKEQEISHFSLRDPSAKKNLAKALSQDSFDYLLSIINPNVLRSDVLNLPAKGAINYHGALLPKYGGLYSSSWAIFNQESTHGITWHWMVEGIDEGDIAKQRSVPTSAHETAFTLNAKCYEAALQVFPELVDALITGRVQHRPQDVAERLYFGGNQRPTPGCVINWDWPAEKIIAFTRALDFGSYENAFGLPKLWLNDAFYYAQEVEIGDGASHTPPGTLVAITNDFLQISTASEDILIRSLKTLEGRDVDLSSWQSRMSPQVGSRLPKLPTALGQTVETVELSCLQRESFWVRALASLEPLSLPISGTVSSEAASAQAFKQSSWQPPNVVQNMAQRASQESTQDFLFAAIAAYLARVGRSDQFDLGLKAALPPQWEQNLSQLFSSVVPCHFDIDCTQSFDAVSDRVMAQAAKARRNQPFHRDIVSRYPQLEALKHSPLEQQLGVTVSLHQQLDDYQPTFVNDFEFAISQTGDCACFYNLERYSDSDIERLLASLTIFVEQCALHPTHPLSSLALLPEAQQQQLIEWNNTQVDYPDNICLHQLFEAQVERTPDAIAAKFEKQQLSYQALNARANQLARHLQNSGVSSGDLVSVFLDRSLEMIVTLLAILKAGGAYVPIDPAYPSDRIAYMLDNAKTAVLIAQSHLSKRLPISDTLVVNLDEIEALVVQEKETNLDLDISTDQLAYTIYTSGSTGKPKGAMNAHKSIVNLLFWMQETYQLTRTDKILQKTPFSFDVSVWEFFAPLSMGASLVFARPEGHKDPDYLAQLIEQEQITMLHFVPSMLRAFLSSARLTRCDSLRRVLCGGEALTADLQEQFFQHFNCELHNLYGPSETAIDVSHWQCQPTNAVGTIPIGYPVANTQLYILDSDLQPVPIGTPGELHIGGVQVGQGYLNRPALTAEKFIPNPFKVGRLYKTGDLACYRPSGAIEYLGRLDYQVKLRGLRIELGEIESALAKHPQVRETVVVVRELQAGDQRLVAYFTTDNDAAETASYSADSKENVAPDTAELSAFLQATLPDYMVPSIFVLLEAIPLTPSGKINRKALPVPKMSRRSVNSEFVEPETPTEKQLAQIWSELLQIEQIGTRDNFFELGGHSLLATQATSQIYQTFGVELPLRTLFETPTITELSSVVDRADSSENNLAVISQRPHADPAQLSFAQQRLWFLHQLEPDSVAYHMTKRLRLYGSLEVDVLQQTFTAIVERHETLRTRFVATEGTPLQIVVPASPFELPLVDISSLAPDQQAERLATVLAETIEQPFDFSRDLMLRAVLVRLSEREHVLQIVLHHIASDGWSLGILTRELSALYQAHLNQQPYPLPELSIQYADFAEWQRNWLSGDRLETLLDYWKQQLSGAPAVLELATDRLRPPKPSYRGSKVYFQLPATLSNELRQLSQQSGTTLFMTLLAAFSILLSRYSRQDDIVVGFPIANRTHSQVEDLIGFFANTLALRTDLSGDPSFTTALSQMRQVALEAYDYQDLPFEKLVEELQPERDLSISPIFQVMFVFQNTPQSEYQLAELNVQAEEGKGETTKFDLTMTVDDSAEVLQGMLTYSTDLFDEATIERMAGHFQTLLSGAVADPSQPVAQIPLLTAGEQTGLLEEWSGGRSRDLDSDKVCIHQLFEQQVVRSPNAVAVVCDGRSLTYAELNARANQLARYLQQQNVEADDIVALCTHRSVEMLVGLLGILKAGAAYLPLDVLHQSPQRLSAMIADAAVAIVLTQADCLPQLLEVTADKLCLDHDWQTVTDYSTDNLATAAQPDNLAYVIYTSGSTGKPKGVTVEHRQIVSYLEAITRRIDFAPNSSYALVSTLSADLGNTMLFPALCTGGALHVLSWECITSPSAFAEYMSQHAIDYLKIVPSHLRALQSVERPARILPQKGLILGGEATAMDWLKGLMAQNPQCAIFNHYGPTETTVGVLTYRVPEGLPHIANLPLGRPLDNSQVYLLDAMRNLVPVGVPGEIFIGGAGVARGYLNRPDLTAARFIDNPFGAGRLYKTGDLARYRSDGTIEFLGRIDQQVKLRGFRIELGEIEAALTQHAAVQQAVVRVQDFASNDQRLVAYIVSDEDIAADELRHHLRQQLPDYMMPAAFMPIASVPLTPNGKVDRKALPVPDLSERQSEQDFVAPRTPEEQQIANIWADVLKLEAVGVHDNFFELGGHSLLATQIISRIREAFRVELPLRTLFESPTISTLAANVDQTEDTALQRAITPISREGDLPLSFAQQRLWLIHQLESNTSAYNMTKVVRLVGQLNVEALAQSLTEIITRHEVLRAIFPAVDGQPEQAIAPARPIDIPITDLQSLSQTHRESRLQQLILEEAQRPFDLETGPLIRIQLLKENPTDHTLIVNIHHIVFDGWSTEIFFNELTALYLAYCNSEPSPLPPLKVQYVDFAYWQQRRSEAAAFQAQLDYWKQQLGGTLPVLQLPTDYPRPSHQDYRSGRHTAVISKALTKQLKTTSQRSGTTLFMTLLAALNVVLHRQSGQDDIIVGTPIAGRPRVETEKLIGLFLNSLALRTNLEGNPTFSQLLDQVRDLTLAAYENQDVPFEKLVQEINPERSLSRHPIFEVMLNFANTPRTDWQMSELTLNYSIAGNSESKFAITLYVEEKQDQLYLTLVYQSALFSAERMRDLLEQYQCLLDQVVTEPERSILSYSLVSEQAAAKLPDPTLPIIASEYEPVPSIVMGWGQKNPAQVAVRQGTSVWTYGELADKARAIALHLCAQNLAPGNTVAVMGDRSFGLIASILGVLSAGGVLLLIDPQLPVARQQLMLKESNAKGVLFINARLEATPAAENASHPALWDCSVVPQTGELLLGDRSSTQALSLPNIQPDDPAYIFFTSGTTGTPKGVLGCHKGLAHFAHWQRQTFNIGPTDRVAQLTSLSFDVVLRDIFLPLTSGATLCLPTADVDLSARTVFPWLEQQQITVMHTVPSLAKTWLMERSQGPSESLPKHLRWLFSAGEPLSARLIEQWRAAFPQMGKIVNLYGPTETTLAKCYYVVPEEPVPGTQPVGQAIPEAQALILSSEGQLCGLGEVGEIVIRTPFCTLGYINAPEQKNRFRQNPYRVEAGDNVFYTGDGGRYRLDGSIEILGRRDRQVKIRGVRIELGEVEAALAQHTAVQQAIVLVQAVQANDKRLVAYILADAGTVEIEALRSHLRQQLPDYMMPAAFVQIEAVPLTPNGKVDRKALPAADFSERQSEQDFVAPRTTTEQQIANIWTTVLKLEAVGIYDNFFELGGHSLLATQIISRICQTFEVELPLRALFEYPTILGLATQIDRPESKPAQQAIAPISRGGDLPLSFAQQRLWLIDQLESDISAYNMARVARLSGQLNFAALVQSMTALIGRHEALRATFPTVDGQPEQAIAPAGSISIPVVDLQSLTASDQEREVQKLIKAEARRPFDLATGPLIRTQLLKLSPTDHTFIVTIHHIVFDGWSTNILFNELSVLYSAYCDGESSPLSPLPVQYVDFASWQQQRAETAAFQSQLDYWKQQLSGTLPVLQLPIDYPRPSQQDYRSGRHAAIVSEALTAQLKAMSQRSGTTLFMTLLAALNVVLHRQSGQDDIIVGTPIAGRPQVETEGLIGLFLNSLALRTNLEGNPTFEQLLTQVRDLTLAAYENQDVPFEKLVQALNPERSLSRHPIFEVLLNFANMPRTDWEMSGLNLSQIKVNNGQSKFAITLYAKEQQGQLHLALNYQRALFSAERMSDFLAQYQRLLEQIVADSERPILSYSLVSDRAAAQLPDPTMPIVASEYEPVPYTVMAWGQRHPAHPAVRQGEAVWTYGELADRAIAIAHHLVSQNLKPGETVAVAGDRSFGLIASILGVLSAGGVLLLIDPQLPAARQQLMLKEANAIAVLSVGSENSSLAMPWQYSVVPQTGEVLLGDRLSTQSTSQTTFLPDIQPDAPAYIFFTSGTTGTPKGVLGCHKGLAHFLSWQRQTFNIGPTDRVAQLTSLSFDVVLRDIFLPLTSGGTLCLPTPDIDLSARTVFPWLEQQQIAVVHTVPTLAKTWLMERSDGTASSLPRRLRWLFSAGEPLSDQLVAQWRAAFPQMGEIVNLYGPTETTLAKCYYIVPEDPVPGTQPVGRAIPEAQALILSSADQLCGIGEVGQIVIRTPFCTLGYLNASEQQRFQQNPYREDAADKVFYTGDGGRYRLDGSIEILGRQDRQVKIRGVRIELGEVEAALMQNSAVQQAVVLVQAVQANDKRLVAYVVLDERAVAVDELRSRLRQQLPDYMMPAAFVQIEAVPLTPNGKVDRSALPAADLTERQSEQALVLPRNANEQQIAEIWADVLALAQVGIHDNFFELGGHSLLATQIISRICQTFEVELPLRTLFQTPTIAGLAEVVEQSSRSIEAQSAIPSTIPKRPHPDTAQLSFAQQRLWFLEQLEPDSIAYRITRRLRLQGSLNVDVLQQTFTALVERHETLRTHFVTTEGTPLQVVAPAKPFELPLIDISSLAPDQQSEKLAIALTRIVEQPFDLSQDLMLRAVLVRLSEREHVLQIVMHHIASDGWSMSIFTQELSALYEAYSNQQPHALPELPVQYADFAEWQRNWLSGDRLEAALTYWKQQLNGAPPVLALPTDRLRPPKPSYHGSKVRFQLSPTVSNSLRELAQQSGTTLFMVLLAAFNVLLSRYSRQEDIVVGFPIANRTNPDIEKLIGFFTNTLTLRIDLSGNPSFSTVLSQVRQVALGAYEHQDLPFEKLVEELQPERDLSVSPIFQVMFVLQNTPQSEYQLTELNVQAETVARETTKFDLTMIISDRAEALQGTLTYSTDLFDEATIERMAEHFQTLLSGAVANPSQPIAQIPLLTPRDRHQLLTEWNNTASPNPDKVCIHQLFEQQVVRSPNAVAVVCDGRSLTYTELNARANQLARYLQQQTVQPNDVVALCAGRSAETIVGLLGILKAGAAYLPIDMLHQSPKRLSAMIDDAAVSIVLTQTDYLPQLSEVTADKLCLDRDWQTVTDHSDDNLTASAKPNDLAYVIYTSGSTGKPKGVTIEHRQIVSYLRAISQRIDFAPNSSFAFVSTLSADLGNTMLFPALCTGGQLHILSWERITSPTAFADYMSQHEIDYLKIVPSHLMALQPANSPERMLPQKGLILGGEATAIDWLKRLRLLSPQCAIFNHYGPTETTVGVLTYQVLETLPNVATLPLGRPLANSQVYLLDSTRNLVPTGVPGEIFIGGAGVARGYLNRPDLTADRFCDNPFGTGRLYRTGDLARYRSDGTIEFLGRIDQQVKLRGFRIELGEIEAALTQHVAVQQAVVLIQAVAPNDERLIAYIVSKDEEVSIDEMRSHLRHQLPDYMLPSAFVPIETVPLTPNGKVDKKALPQPDLTERQSEQDFVAPHTTEEQQIANIWADVLKLDRVGIDDNFFELGGHSLLATQVISRIQSVLSVTLPLRTLFESPTVAGLAAEIEQQVPDAEHLSIQPQPRDSDLPLSFTQQRLWLLNQLEPESSAYNMTRATRLTGRLNIDALSQSLTEIVARHEVLRTTFQQTNGQPNQVVHPVSKLQLPIVDLQSLPEAEREEAAQRLVFQEARYSFDLEQGPLVRVQLLTLSEADHILVINLHHIVFDGWSFSLFFDELSTLYAAFCQNQPSPLPALPIQYADFAVWQQQQAETEAFQAQLNYWKSHLADAPHVLELPTDYPRPAVQTHRGAAIFRHLPVALTQQLKQLSQQEGATLFMTLLSSFKLLCYRLTNQERITVGAPIAGRNQSEVESLIGFFVSNLVLHTDLSGNPSCRELLQRVRRVAIEGYANQDVPFEKLLEELQPERDLSRTPLFQVWFNMLNSNEKSFELDSLTTERFEKGKVSSKFDLTLYVSEKPQGIAIRWVYNTALFKPATIEYMAQCFETLLANTVAQPEHPIETLTLLAPPAESLRQPVEPPANLTSPFQAFPKTEIEQSIPARFEAQVEQYAERIAIKTPQYQWTYRDLDQRANRIAQSLLASRGQAAERIALLFEQDAPMIAGLLGVLKAGKTYVPLDPNYPVERLRYILSDSQATAIATQSNLVTLAQDLAAERPLEIIECDSPSDSLRQRPPTELPTTAPKLATSPDSIAYLLYTSGSTGQPKGVMQTHRNVLHFIRNHTQQLHLSSQDSVLLLASYSSDAAVVDIFSTLLNGATIYPFNVKTKGLADLAAWIDDSQITLYHSTPTLYRYFLSHIASSSRAQAQLSSIRAVVLGGEEMKPKDIEQYQTCFDADCLFLNLYGSTESTINAYYPIDRTTDLQRRFIPVGYPVDDTEIQLLTPDGQDAQLYGEIAIRSEHVAPGYWQKPELTAQAFLPDPEDSERRIYRTGDLGRRRADGAIEFLGRQDFQLKIRGFRVEPGEIETVLAAHSLVQKAVVVGFEDESGEQQLVAYVVSATPQSITASELRKHLQQQLPDYMLPSAFIFLEALPLTPSGKVNRRALPAPDLAQRIDDIPFVAPQTSDEKQLSRIWCDLLKLERVGIYDNFFELGGHSLLATQAISRIREAFSVELPLQALFAFPTVAGLAEAVEQQQKKAQVAKEIPAIMPLSRQRRKSKRASLS